MSVARTDCKAELLLGRGHAPGNHDVYCVPGGHWEVGETLVVGVRREIREEAGIEVRDLRFVALFDFHHVEKSHAYLSVWFECVWASGQPVVNEPANRAGWGWYDVEQALSLPLLHLDRILIRSARAGEVYGYPESLPLISFKDYS